MVEISLVVTERKNTTYATVPKKIKDQFKLKAGITTQIKIENSMIPCKLTKYSGFLIRKEISDLLNIKEGSIVHVIL